MTLDFWNNPLLVTAMRARFRGGWMIHTILLYPLLLLMLGACIPFFYPKLQDKWPQYGFTALMISQVGLCGLMATAATSQSMRAEVVNQTLDFLRLTPLTQRQILLGKLLGESSTAFFLAVGSFPVGLLCLALGGVDFLTFLLMYVNLLVYVVVCGSAGLITRLEAREDKRMDAHLMNFSGWGFGIYMVSCLWLPQPMQIITLALLPAAMAIAGYVSFHVMERILESPFKPSLSRPLAYGLLIGADVMAALFVAATPLSVGARAAAFWGVHLVASAQLINGITAWREGLKSWAWRFRGRTSWFRDAWYGDRSGNGLAVLTFAVIGLAIFLLVFVPTELLVENIDELAGAGGALAGGALLSFLMVVAFGWVVQWCSLIAGRSGKTLGIVFLGVLVGPYLLGSIENVPWIAYLSPFAHYAHWFTKSGTIQDEYAIVVLGLALLSYLARSSFHTRMGNLARAVDRKLEKMSVPAGTTGR